MLTDVLHVLISHRRWNLTNRNVPREEVSHLVLIAVPKHLPTVGEEVMGNRAIEPVALRHSRTSQFI